MVKNKMSRFLWFTVYIVSFYVLPHRHLFWWSNIHVLSSTYAVHSFKISKISCEYLC